MGAPQEMMMFDPCAFMNLPDSLEFDPTTMFRSDTGDLNFERDFGQWFNPDDIVRPELEKKDQLPNFERDFGQWFDQDNIVHPELEKKDQLPDSLEFGPTMFRPDTEDLNFERDFERWWFGRDDVVGPGLDEMESLTESVGGLVL
jgi:hypothetical protein